VPFTDNCDLYGAIHEDGINRVVRHIMRQRPSLFNYGTADAATTFLPYLRLPASGPTINMCSLDELFEATRWNAPPLRGILHSPLSPFLFWQP
jgi:hypothetical protein